jgi:hypothetical protein
MRSLSRTHTHTHTHMHTCTHALTYSRTHTPKRTHAHTPQGDGPDGEHECSLSRKHTRTHARTHMHTRARAHVLTHQNARTRTLLKVMALMESMSALGSPPKELVEKLGLQMAPDGSVLPPGGPGACAVM